MLRFLQSVRLKATSPLHYKSLIGGSFWDSIRYLFLLIALLATVRGLFFGFAVFSAQPEIKGFLDKAGAYAFDLYPENLISTFKNGELSINQPEPFFIEFPESIRAELQKEKTSTGETLEHFIAIDTRADVGDYSRYRSAAMMTKTALVLPDKGSTWKVYPYSSWNLEKELVINQTTYQAYAKRVLPYLDYVIPGIKILVVLGVIIGPWIFAAFSLISYLFSGLLCAAFMWIVSRILWREVTYIQLLFLTLYGFTPALLIDFVSSWLSLGLPYGCFSLITLIWMSVVIWSIGSQHDSKPAGL